MREREKSIDMSNIIEKDEKGSSERRFFISLFLILQKQDSIKSPSSAVFCFHQINTVTGNLVQKIDKVCDNIMILQTEWEKEEIVC